ncbi:MAG: DNA-3-methyladenine glycosylase I [Gammaproteobacteria bacterium]|jgi:DNA-3-methyladenine glycosylase I|nr:DNA-3-methyladenine glycosylase I [Gammaproteobacteria bacterium]MBT4494604.1 DNA-3-methyladenine glycosylase I [Gammaproteobacteria bacterium]MBT7371452.1 DNA-3-methyladenine glycosylase I [Gammaproteobacteria bacterium]
MAEDNHRRCAWSGEDPLYIAYHDEEWGVPCFDDDSLFEFLLLEGAQAGLAWITVLRKREGYRRALEGFDAGRIARYGKKQVGRLMNDTGIIRNRLKIESAITNARAFLDIQERQDSFSEYIWQFVEGAPVQNRFRSMSRIPASTVVSEQMSRQLKKEGFKFVGPTICYAYMQATGMVNDHLVNCYRHEACQKLAL